MQPDDRIVVTSSVLVDNHPLPLLAAFGREEAHLRREEIQLSS